MTNFYYKTSLSNFFLRSSVFLGIFLKSTKCFQKLFKYRKHLPKQVLKQNKVNLILSNALRQCIET